MKTQPTYYECQCGFYHVLGYKGTCDARETRFISEELDEMHAEGWQEVFTDQEDEAAPIPQVAVRRKNYNTMMGLTPETDVEGHKIEVGCRVRCFDGTYYDSERDYLMGMNTTGESSYVEGRVVAIEEYTPPNWHSGIYYVIDAERIVCPVVERTRSDFVVREDIRTIGSTGRSYILANGNECPAVRVETGIFIVDSAETYKSFGVCRI